ncbi:hypothetical protein [Ancylomarina longa]|nr:hypothetical protein [Ancylomarina longa]
MLHHLEVISDTLEKLVRMLEIEDLDASPLITAEENIKEGENTGGLEKDL